MCVGLFALFRPIGVAPYFQNGVLLILAVCLVQLVFLGTLGRLPRPAGSAMAGSYVMFLMVRKTEGSKI